MMNYLHVLRSYLPFTPSASLWACFYLFSFTSSAQTSLLRIEWENRIGGDNDQQAKSICSSGDGGYVIAGWTKSPGNGKDMLVVKTDGKGNKIWEKIFGNVYDDYATACALSSEGNYGIVGVTTNIQTKYTFSWIVVLDKAGKKLWEMTYSGSEWDAAKALVPTADGGFAVAGVRKNMGDQDKEMTVIRINKKGGKLWEAPTGIRYYDDEANAIAIAPDEGFMIAGWSKKDVGYSKALHIARMDKRGTIQWNKTYGGEQLDYAKAITPTSDGRFIIAAATKSKGAGEEDFWILKINNTGEIEWDRVYGGKKTDTPNCLITTNDNGCIAGGWTSTKGNGNENAYIIKFDAKGALQWERSLGNYDISSVEGIINTDNGYVIAGWASLPEEEHSALWIAEISDNSENLYGQYISEQLKKDPQKNKDDARKDAVKYYKDLEGPLSKTVVLTETDIDIIYRGGGDPLKGLNISKAKNMYFGEYFALIIGIDKYSGTWQPLKNAVKDAQGVEQLLKSKYNFNHFKTLYNEQATRTNIIRELEWLVEHAGSKDNVFIYYSGHGEYKQSLNKGFWVPVDAQSASTAAYISNSDIQTFLGGINSKHTLLISDACFSGDIFRGNTVSVPFNNSDKYYSQVNAIKSRQALTSGGIEPVMDGGKEGHSVFAYYLIQSLNENADKYFDASQLFSKIKIPVVNNSEQTPILNQIKNTGDEGGQFIFILK